MYKEWDWFFGSCVLVWLERHIRPYVVFSLLIGLVVLADEDDDDEDSTTRVS